MSRFVFVVPAFNASQTIGRTILTVATQTHGDWRMIIRDDMSTDRTPDIVDGFSRSLGVRDRISLSVNSEKHWEVRNIVEMLKECDDDEIICRLDGDDWLCDCDALTIIDERYRNKGVDALWTAHRWGFTGFNISAPMPANADPYSHPWVSSHLKTFRKKVISGVSDANFRGSDGEYFKRIGDQAIYLPVLSKSAGNWHFEPIVAYHYTIDMRPETFQTDDARFQKAEAEFLRDRGFLK